MTQIEQPDAGEILNAVGDAVYEWRLDTDTLNWSGNAVAVLGIADVGEIATGPCRSRLH